MIGFLLTNSRNELCFVDSEKRGGIASLIYVPDMRMASIVLDDGSTEVITHEISDTLHPGMTTQESVLVVQLDDAGHLIHEHRVPLVRQ
ncbi:MAG: hypothetical protein AB7E80_01615 [Hyphomicrobiaceae bacterium]